MKNSKVIEKIRATLNRLKTMHRLPSAKSSKRKPPTTKEKFKLDLGQPQSIAYQLIGEKTIRALPLFRDLDANLLRAGLKINFRAYVSLTVLAAASISLVTLAVAPLLLLFVFKMALMPALLFGVAGSMFTFAFSIVGFYIYPIYRADVLKRALEDELPFTTGYMAILTSAGVSPEKIFYSLSSLSVPLAISLESRDIVRNVNLFGLDIISALEKTSARTPSEKFREMLEGFISTIHSGGNLSAFLREKSTQYMKLKRMGLRKFADTLSALSEFYVTLLVTGPLLLVIMLAVMAMLGGGGLFGLSPNFLLNLLTYLGIPLASIIFLILLDTVSPKW